jgi:hypothetical protein
MRSHRRFRAAADIMQRIPCPERDDWQATAKAAGFDFHTMDGERYWDERAYYAFTLDEIERRIMGCALNWSSAPSPTRTFCAS